MFDRGEMFRAYGAVPAGARRPEYRAATRRSATRWARIESGIRCQSTFFCDALDEALCFVAWGSHEKVLWHGIPDSHAAPTRLVV
jgi:hypothetical protein